MLQSLTLDATVDPNLPPCSANLWRWVWNAKAQRGETVAQLSGRAKYTDLERWTLVADAVVLLDLKREDELLDIGCAAGYIGQWFASALQHYVGVDYSVGSVLRFGWPKSAIADARKLPFKDGAFGKSYMGSVLLCMSKEECLEALTEMRRVTRTRAVVTDTLIGAHDGHHDTNRVTWFESMQEVADMMVKAGWKKIHFSRMHPVLPHYERAINAVLEP